MTTNDELLSVVPSQDGPEHIDLDSLDDVEGHGLKEIVVGLSAAAVMTGGAASAASVSFGSGPEPLKTPGAIVNTVDALRDDATKLTNPTTMAAQQTAGGAAATATTMAGTAITAAGDTVTTVDGMAAGVINQVGDAARPIIADPTGTALRATSPTTTRANQAADKALLGVSKTTTAAMAAANAVVHDASTAARYAISVIDTTVAETSGTATTIVLGLKASDADAGAKAQSKDAWVVAKVGNEVVGSAQMDNGAWTVTIDSRHLSSPITFSVGGHHDIAPLTVHLSR